MQVAALAHVWHACLSICLRLAWSCFSQHRSNLPMHDLVHTPVQTTCTHLGEQGEVGEAEVGGPGGPVQVCPRCPTSSPRGSRGSPRGFCRGSSRGFHRGMHPVPHQGRPCAFVEAVLGQLGANLEALLMQFPTEPLAACMHLKVRCVETVGTWFKLHLRQCWASRLRIPSGADPHSLTCGLHTSDGHDTISVRDVMPLAVCTSSTDNKLQVLSPFWRNSSQPRLRPVHAI